MKRALLIAVVFALVSTAASAQTVFLVRHAERADEAGGGSTMMAKDPDLSAAGRERAKALAATLGDAGITAIFVTEFRRTQQTGEPLAKALGVPLTVVRPGEGPTLLERIAAASANGNVLVIGHSNTVPETIKELGVSGQVIIGQADYDNLFVVTRGQKSTLIRLHYGAATPGR